MYFVHFNTIKLYSGRSREKRGKEIEWRTCDGHTGWLVLLGQGDGLRVGVGRQLPHTLHELLRLVAVQDGKLFGGEGVERSGALDHRLRNGEAVLAVQRLRLVQPDQEYPGIRVLNQILT